MLICKCKTRASALRGSVTQKKTRKRERFETSIKNESSLSNISKDEKV